MKWARRIWKRVSAAITCADTRIQQAGIPGRPDVDRPSQAGAPTKEVQMNVDLADDGFKNVRTLGAGSEGTVYKAFRDGRPYVVKICHDLSGSEADLVAYSERVTEAEFGFFPIDLIYREGRLVGLYYRYKPLFRIPEGAFALSERLCQALLSQYCLSQAYLMRERALEMVDGAQFLLAEDGRLHYVDYGSTIVRADNDWCRTRGHPAFSFLTVLFELRGIALDRSLRQPGFDYAQPCPFVGPAHYEALLRRSPWAASIVERISQAKASVFLDPDFYLWIAGLYEPAIPLARWLVIPDKLRRAVQGSL